MALYLPDDNDIAFLRRLKAWQESLRGDGIQNTPEGATIRRSSSRRRSAPAMPTNTGYWALITAATEISTNRWAYDFSQAYLEDDDVWYALTDGRSGAYDDGTHALNIREMLNDTSGQQGNGITPSLLPEGFEIVASVVGYPVWMMDVPKPGGTVRPMFIDSNGVDGACT